MHWNSLSLILLVVAFSSPTYGQATWHKDDDADLTTIKLTVSPAAEPVPAFKHRLTTRPIDQRSGNAAVWLYRVFAGEGYDHQAKVRRNRETYGEERYDSWISQEDVPLGELPIEDASKAFRNFRTELDYLREAARRLHCDWERGLEHIRGPEIFSVLLPEIHQMRNVSRTLALGTRLAIAEERYDDALDLVRINHHMAQHASADPFLVSQLVGVAITGVGNRSLVEIIAAPDSPNLYWALSELPSPMFDMRESLRFEMAMGHRIFPFLRDAETAEHSPDEWTRLWANAWSDLQQISHDTVWDASEMLSLGMSLLHYSQAKQRLIDWGFDQQQVEQMPVGQVLAIYTGRVYDRIAHEFEKVVYVPFRGAGRLADQADEFLHDSGFMTGSPDREVLPAASMLIPALRAVRNAGMRLDREIAGLRVIEALRMHAAEPKNRGSLPRDLSEITCVPVPENPVTGQPFVYYREGSMGVLEFPRSDGITGDNRRYEITLR